MTSSRQWSPAYLSAETRAVFASFEDSTHRVCPTCRGVGELVAVTDVPYLADTAECRRCKGEGYVRR